MDKSPGSHPFVGMKPHVIIGVWQTMTHETDGKLVSGNEFYFDYDDAKKNCNGMHELEPVKRFVIEMDNGTYFLLGDMVDIYEDADDRDRIAALKKLTDREKKLLKL